MTYTAYYITDSGERVEWTGLRRTQAIWRDNWMTRNSGRLRLKRWGWDWSEGCSLANQRDLT